MSWFTAVTISTHKRDQLKAIAGDTCNSRNERQQALIILLLHEGMHPRDVAQQLAVSENKVWDYRQEWKEETTVFIRRRKD